MEAQRQQLQPALDAQKQLKVNLEQQLKLTPSQILAASQVSENPTIQGFSQELQKAQAELSIMTAQLSENHPEVQASKEKLVNLEANLRKETQKVLGPNLSQSGSVGAVSQPQSELQKTLGQQLISTINEIQVLNIQNQALNQAALSIDEELRRFPTVKRQHKDLMAKLEIDRQLLNKLLLQREDFRVKTAQKEIPWQVIKKPTLLKDANGQLISTADKDWYKIALATLGGLFLGLGAALLKEKRQDIFYGLDDLKDALPLKLLGTVPLDKELKSVSRANALMPSESDEETYFRYGYAQRMIHVSENIYANLRYLLEEPSNQSLVIGSVALGDGKTTLAINLAKAVAGMGQRVLLVDANLAAPQLHSRFGLPNFQGLSDILAKDIDPNELIQRSPMHGSLFLLTAGQMSRKASKLLASNQMAYLMGQLQNMFDLVIYDTYNLQNSSGASFLALNAQGLIWVVGIQKTRRSAILKTLERLQSSRIPIKGVIANYVREAVAKVDDVEELDPLLPVPSGEEEEDEFEIFRVDS
ncbi:MAG: AAA family ATPase [Acaryochloridaceae cyanobacterium RL_2_7]|nr:AAA family ATPase [Acaryochloridaceae cyanobacterium RL_2_7]